MQTLQSETLADDARHPAMPLPDFHTLPALVAAHARERPAATALICGERQMTYGALEAAIDAVAAALQADGAATAGGSGGAVAVCAASSIEYLTVFLGTLRAGLAVAPLAPSSTPEQLVQMVADSGAKHLFLDAGTAALLAGVDATVRRISLDGSANPGTGPAFTPLAAWALAGRRPAPVELQPRAPFNIIYSSGTTGTPKGIVQSHAMRWAQVRRAESGGYDTSTVTLIATPLYSNTTLVAVIPTLARGGAVVLLPKFDCAAYLALAERHRATHTMLVPVQYQRLMAWPEFDRHDLSSFRFKACTSAPFRAELKAEVLRRWPGGLTEYYGLTEGGATCLLSCHLFPDKLHTVGQPAEGHDLRLIDEDGNELTREDIAAGREGEIVGRSPVMMNGYHNRPDPSRAIEWFDTQGRRFLRSGDVGRFDADGFLILMDRRKDMIISGGFNIYPSDLEAELRGHPAVADVAVVGVPSEAWGETPVAFVVRRDGDTSSADAIRDWFNQRVGKTQRLADLRFIAELPRSAIGKVLKRELRDGYKA